MCMLCTLIPFTERRPPEGVDLFVCGNPDCTRERTYGVMQYFEKGTQLPDVFCTNAPTRDERLIDALFRMKEGCRIAPETGYYFMDTVEEDDAGCDAVWLLSGINPLDSVYAVINSEDMELICGGIDTWCRRFFLRRKTHGKNRIYFNRHRDIL